MKHYTGVLLWSRHGDIALFGSFNYLLLTIKFTAEISDKEIIVPGKRLRRESILSMCMYFKPRQNLPIGKGFIKGEASLKTS